MPSNREVVEQFYERFNHGDLEAAMALITDDLEMTAPGMETVTGFAHLRDYLESIFDPMPDAHDALLAVYEAGDSVIVEGPVQRHVSGGRRRATDRSALC